MCLTMTVADSWAEGRGRGDVLPVGCLEACLLLLLPLLVALLHLALAHPAWGQRDDIITTHYGSCGKTKAKRTVMFCFRHGGFNQSMSGKKLSRQAYSMRGEHNLAKGRKYLNTSLKVTS